jgi:hypothetical protein
MGSTI